MLPYVRNPSEREKRGLEDPEHRTAETAKAGLVKGETACNRVACQAPLVKGARWLHRESGAAYCATCAFQINSACQPPPLCVHEQQLKATE